MYYSLVNVFGDPFWLTTVPMALIGWVVALVGSVLNSVQDSSQFPVFSWWGLAFQLTAIALTLHVAFSNQIRMYRLAVLSFLSVATVYSTNTTNNFVWRQNSNSGTAAAGNILLSIINFVWILYFGTTQDEPVHTYIDSFAAYKRTSPAQSEFHRRMREKRRHMMQGSTNNLRLPSHNDSGPRGTQRNPYHLSDIPNNINIGAPTGFSRQTDTAKPNPRLSTAGSNPDQPEMIENPLNSTYLYSVDQLNRHGISGHNVDSNASMARGSIVQRYSQTRGMAHEDPYFGDAEDELLPSSTHTIAKARARYSYDGRDESELPFSEGDILDVCDMTGNWWWCKRDGEYGSCPSNYLELINPLL